MECCHQQADLPELVQDEDVCYLGCHPHVVWSVPQPLQPHVSGNMYVCLLKLAACPL